MRKCTEVEKPILVFNLKADKGEDIEYWSEGDVSRELQNIRLARDSSTNYHSNPHIRTSQLLDTEF